MIYIIYIILMLISSYNEVYNFKARQKEFLTYGCDEANGILAAFEIFIIKLHL